jgi:hypothetical protein
MKRFLSAFALLFLAFSSQGAEIITATLTFTNTPTNGAAIVVNGATRYWTNNASASPSTLILTNATIGGSATNFFLHISRYPFNSDHIPGRSSSNIVTIKGGVGAPMAVTAAGYTTVTYATNTASASTYLVRVPITEEVSSNQVAIASLLVKGQSDSSTNSFSTNATAMANYTTLTTGQTLSNKTVRASVLENSRITNGILHVTNGFGSNLVLHTPTLTNGVNYGNAFDSPGVGTGSLQLGTGAQATNTHSVAVGPSASALGSGGTALGYASYALEAGTALGGGAAAWTNAVAIGPDAAAVENSSIAIGPSATAVHVNSVTIGSGSSTTSSNQIMLGTATIDVRVNNILQAGSITNSTFTGTNTLQGSIATPVYALGSLANGNNAGVLFSNVWNQISGPTAAFTINGIAHGNGNRNGLIIEIENPTGYQMTIADNSGVDPTAANRIRTGIGADITITNNPGWVRLIYDASASRWKVQFRSN